MDHIKRENGNREINRLLNRSGRLWQDEYFDRVLRDGEFNKYVDYICRNPERAGPVTREEDYRWLWLDREAWHAELCPLGASGLLSSIADPDCGFQWNPGGLLTRQLAKT